MIRSMTGYGKAETTTAEKKITAEIRTLNSKQLDLTVKLPPMYRAVEFDVRSSVSQVIQRGKTDLYITCEHTGAEGRGAIDGEAFTAYYRQMGRIGASLGLKWGSDELDAAAIPALLRLPDVIRNADAEIPDEELEAVREAVIGALAHIGEFREQEGRAIAEDLLHRVGEIERLMKSVEPYEAPRVELLRKRIRENIESMNIPVDSNRLEQEMIFYVEKLDITEEKVRLANHCSYFRQVAAREENPGRKLGFIAQEMGREINTMGSKANDASIQQIVVQMKDELEKIKEQVLNVL